MQKPTVMLAAALLGLPGFAAEKVFDFGEARLNEPPAGFRSVVTGSGPPGDWRVLLEELPPALPPLSPKAPNFSKRPVLAQLSRDRTDDRQVLLIFEGETFGDFKLTTRFKIVEGEVEQMAGIAFRIQDERNYYYIRANAKDGNLYFFKWVDGQLLGPRGPRLAVPKGEWQELAIEARGNQIRCWLNGREAWPTLHDNSFASGKMGFWTKSDAVSYFADTRIVYTSREPFAQVLVRDALKRYPRLLGLRIYAIPTNEPPPRLIASTDPAELGRTGSPEIQDTIATGTPYQSKGPGRITLTLPLRDGNGDTAGAVQVVMKSFPGQTEENALARARPVVKGMQSRIQSPKDLFE